EPRERLLLAKREQASDDAARAVSEDEQRNLRPLARADQRHEVGQVGLDPAPFFLRATVKDTLRMLAPRAPARAWSSSARSTPTSPTRSSATLAGCARS